MSLALAGTLGVGNIAGVATAIVAGGAGAVFWMWISALIAMSVKYAEVVLAIHYRRYDGGRYHGGSMYYIRDGAPHGRLNIKASVFIASFFAVLCLANALLTGNIVQVNSAAAASGKVPAIVVGCIFAVMMLIISFGGAKRISSFTVALIPFLSIVYILLSMFIIVKYAQVMPRVLTAIFSDAFNFSSAAGGISGFCLNRAIRFGVTRGIFSNEAGCGTAPTAHAAADVRSPHHQGCFGIFEVFIDTILLCSMTAFVILIAMDVGNMDGLDGIELSVGAYTLLAGKGAGIILSLSVILFAFATVICQSYYGLEALSFFTKSKTASNIYIIASAAVIVIGSVISAPLVWQLADLFVGIMTVINCICLVRRRNTVTALYQQGYEKTPLHN